MYNIFLFMVPIHIYLTLLKLAPRYHVSHFLKHTGTRFRQIGGLSQKPKLKYLRQQEKRSRLIKHNVKGMLGDEENFLLQWERLL